MESACNFYETTDIAGLETGGPSAGTAALISPPIQSSPRTNCANAQKTGESAARIDAAQKAGGRI
jgi:hypothetical protein